MTGLFPPREKAARPLVLPRGVRDLASMGQFSEVPNGVLSNVECPIGSAHPAVHRPLRLPLNPRGLHTGQYVSRVLPEALRALHHIGGAAL